MKSLKELSRVKRAVSNPPALALPDFSQPFLIECDALGK
jgi:hypothetical protein